MTRAKIGGSTAAAAVLVVLATAAGRLALDRDDRTGAATSAPVVPSATAPTAGTGAEMETHQGFLHGRITTLGGATYEGRLRFGGDQEAFWGDYFNGFKDENPWFAHLPTGRRIEERRPIGILGFKIAERERPTELGRYFMARFGDIARIDAGFADVRVTLKSGTVFVLDRFEAGDFDDGVRVWDRERGIVDLDSLWIRRIEFLPAPSLDAVPERLYGTVRTRRGDFTGFVQWDREECVGSDELNGYTGEGKLGLRFDTIRSIARHSRDGVAVTLRDGSEIVLAGGRGVGLASRGIYVDDRRYGRVLVAWDAFERLDFVPADSGPAYGDFPPGRPLAGRVTTRAGGRLTGRLVYDLDESETTETLDAPSQGVNFTIPFGRIASIVPRRPDEPGGQYASVILRTGEELRLECEGDLGEANTGMLIFVDGGERPEFLPWAEVERIDFDRLDEPGPPLRGPCGCAFGSRLPGERGGAGGAV